MDRVGRYQLLDKLGEGGMGVVYKAYDPLIQRVVAVKLINSARTDDSVLRERFFAEARAAGHLSHRNIVTVYDLGEDSGRPYFAMEFLEGQDLGRMIRSGQPPTLTAKIDLMAQAGRGLAYAHARGVVHRDVKPANIFVTTAGDVKVLDFGLARLARPLGSDLTRTRPFIGTVSYMAPEQVRGEPADPRTDLFAFGVVLYEMLSGGRPAFETDSLASTMHRILTEEPEPLAALDASLPAELISIVERALAKSRDDRYQRVDDMLADLAVFRASLNVGVTPLRISGGSSAFPRTPGPQGPSLDGLDITIGHEAAVEVRTPPPRTMPASPAPPPAAPPSPVPEALPSASNVGAGQRHWRPRTWAAVLVIAAGLAATTVWRAAMPRDAAQEGTRTAVETGVGQAGTTGLSPTMPGQAVQQPRESSTAPPREPDEAATPPPGGEATRGAAAPARKADRAAGREDTTARREKASEKDETAGEKGAGAARKDEEAARLLAQSAFVEAARARGRAESVGAERLAPDMYVRALEAEQEAADRFRAGAFEGARSGFVNVVVLFERAEGEARAEQARQAEQERARDAASSAVEPPRPPAAGVPTIPAPSTPSTSGSGTPGSGTSTPSTPGTSTPGTTSTTREAVLTLLSRYSAALEARSLARLKQIWPGLGGAQESAIADEFQHARAIAVTLSSPQVDVQGPTASVSCRRNYRLETRDGHRLETDTRTVFALRQAAGGWVIENVRHEAR